MIVASKAYRVLMVIAFLTVMINSFAQQPPQYTQYIFNNYLMNPAITGIENYTEVKLGHRNQWQGIKEAPVTSYVSAHTPLGDKYVNRNINSFPAAGATDPMSRSYLQNYMASDPHHGIGLYAIKDEAGPLSFLNVDITYAYHLGINHSTNLSLGIAAGISQMHLDVSKVYTSEEGDPTVAANSNMVIQPDLAVGLWLYGRSYFMGISAQSLLGSPINAASSRPKKNLPPMFFTAGHKFFLSENIAALPSTLVKFAGPGPLNFDLNLKVAFYDKFWIGGSYRKNDAISGMLGFSAKALVNVSYSYDYTTSELNTQSTGTHEIVFGLLLNNRYRLAN